MQFSDVVRNYDRSAKYYDSLMDLVFGRLLDLERYRRKSIDLVGDLDGATVLDVGCGTGRNFPILVPRVGDHGRILGVDCSKGMLREAQLSIERNGWSNIELLHGDAVTLENITEPVDAIVATWCYGTVYDLGAALHRAAHLLKPGGRFSMMSFARSRPERGVLRWMYPLYRFGARCAGFDMSGEFGNASLTAKWEEARRVLKARFEEYYEESYLDEMGLIIVAASPRPSRDRHGNERGQADPASGKASCSEASLHTAYIS